MPVRTLSGESSSDILVTLLLCGLMGMLGQGIRAAIGLKNALSATPGSAARRNEFSPAYFATSLMIGFIAGALAGVLIGLDKLMHFDADNINVLAGIAAAGYAGVDFIENAFFHIIPHPDPGSAFPKAARRRELETERAEDEP